MRRLGLIVLGTLACASQSSSAQSRDRKLDRMVKRLVPLTRSVSEQFDAIAQRVRRDSGSTRADSAAFDFWRKPWAVTRRLDMMTDVDIHSAIDPDGDVAAEAARKHALVVHPTATRDSLLRMLVASGVKPFLGEGPLYFALSAAHLQGRVGCCVTDAMREYLSMEQATQERPAAADGSLLVPLDEVAERMIRFERYLASWPGSPARSEVAYNRDRYLGWILYGITTEKVFHFRSLELNPDYRGVMERIASTRPAEYSGKMAQAMLDIVRTNGYRRTPAVTEYMKARWNEIRPPQ